MNTAEIIKIKGCESAEILFMPPRLKLKKDGTPKQTKTNNPKGNLRGKTEVFALNTQKQLKDMLNYFISNQDWQGYLLYIIGINMGRRASDMISLQWKHFFNEITGQFRKDIEPINEKKTDKYASPHINEAVKNAIRLYCEKTKVKPSENNYTNYIFPGKSCNTHIVTKTYYNRMKIAAKACGIEQNIGTHTLRKTFGLWQRRLHPTDPDSMIILQDMLNHENETTTRRYIGLTKEKVDSYYDDIGTFFTNYVCGNEKFKKITNTSVAAVDVTTLREIITMAYQEGMANAAEKDVAVHLKTIDVILEMVEEESK